MPDAPYEAPEAPEIHVRTADVGITECAAMSLDYVLPRVRIAASRQALTRPQKSQMLCAAAGGTAVQPDRLSSSDVLRAEHSDANGRTLVANAHAERSEHIARASF